MVRKTMPIVQHRTHHHVHVVHLQAARQVLAEPGPAEHGLDQHGAVEQAAKGQRHDGQQLHADIPEGVAPDHLPRAEALGASGDDVFLAQAARA